MIEFLAFFLLHLAATRSDMLVSTAWLAGHLNDSNLVVLHVARERSSYEAGHIPGARFLPLGELAVTRDGVPSELPPPADLRALFERVGVSDDTRVILYGDNLGLAATRAWFTLDYLGHGDRAALLDGGLEQWRAEQRAVFTETPEFKPGRFTPQLRRQVVASLETVRNLAPEVLLLDARPASAYSNGHIPGAVNLFWMEDLVNKDNPVLRAPDQLRRIYETAGAAPGRKVITSCQVGMTASHLYFALKYLGYDTAMFNGSFSQWSQTPGAPIATGPNPK
jgi:thiosulfate/3-mercaptopyruvate sulfurtransferase